MTAFYKLVRTPNNQQDDPKVVYHYRFDNQVTTRMWKVLRLASAFSSFSSADIIGVLEVLKKVIVMELTSGHNVELKDFAFFSASLTGPPVYDRRKSHASEVELRTVKIRAASSLKRQVREELFLSKSSRKEIPSVPKSRRRNMLLNYLEKTGL